MIKRIEDLTPEEKQRFLRATIKEIKKTSPIPWKDMERRIQKEIDDTFDDKRFEKMKPGFKEDAIAARKEFGKNKPSLVDYMLWGGKFATHSDYVYIPDK